VLWTWKFLRSMNEVILPKRNALRIVEFQSPR